MSDVAAGLPQFNLVDDPWLPCVRANGATAQLSARDLLRDAHEIKDLSLDARTQYPPILRMVLAVLYRALAGPCTDEEWATLWDHGELPMTPIDAYLDRWRDRFELFHPDYPYAQAGGLRSASGETKTVAQLIPYVASGNNTPLFSAARDAEPPALSPAEAARWLVHAHAWDTAAIKTGAVGDRRAKAGKTTGNPTGPLGQLGVVIPTGRTLWHTLMYNLVTLHPNRELSGPDDRPVWERELTAEWAQRQPDGLCDLYTWPSRRIRLVPEHTEDGWRVRRCLVCAGDRLHTHLLRRLEPHTTWRHRPELAKRLEAPEPYLPQRHQIGRALWRGLGTILVRGKPEYERPPVLTELGGNLHIDALADQVVQLCAYGIEYGNQAAVISETYVDDLPMPVAVLKLADNDLDATARDATTVAERAANQVGALARNLETAAGCSDDKLRDGRRDAARNQLYADLDVPFREWVGKLAADTSSSAALAAWCAVVKDRTWAIADTLLAEVTAAAVRGRKITLANRQERHLDAALAEIWFRGSLRDALRQASPSDGEQPGDQPEDNPEDNPEEGTP